MKVSLDSENKVFQPIKLTINIETEKELQVLLQLFGSTSSIPRQIYHTTVSIPDKEKLLSSLMSAIYTPLSEVFYRDQ